MVWVPTKKGPLLESPPHDKNVFFGRHVPASRYVVRCGQGSAAQTQHGDACKCTQAFWVWISSRVCGISASAHQRHQLASAISGPSADQRRWSEMVGGAGAEAETSQRSPDRSRALGAQGPASIEGGKIAWVQQWEFGWPAAYGPEGFGGFWGVSRRAGASARVEGARGQKG